MSQVVVGTAGHIDHGKTTLVKALTGVNTDSLAEEKARGMTIDIGFAYLNNSITIIDVPGHEKFIRNMVAGAANIHFGLIVVAADDGIMPQTIEHLDILTQLGIHEGWIAITKVSMINDKEWIDLIEVDIQEKLNARGFHAFSINRVDSLTGVGLEKLKSDILQVRHNLKPKPNLNYFRMHVDRVFIKTGFGTILTGTVVNGYIKKGDDVDILPNMLNGRIRGLQSHGGIADMVVEGDRAAINMSNIRLEEVCRGSVICTKGFIKPTKIIIANISMIESTGWKIKNNQRLRFHFGTVEILGRAKIADGKVLEKGESLNLIIYLESQASVALDDRFVVRSYSPMDTIAGGIILHSDISYLSQYNSINRIISEMPILPSKRFKYLVRLNWMNPKKLKYWRKLFFNSNYEIQLPINYDDFKLSKDNILYSKYGLEKSIEKIKQYFDDYYKKNPLRKVVSVHSMKKLLSWSEEWLEIVMAQMIQKKIIEECKGGYTFIDYEIQFLKKDIEDIKSLEKFFINNRFEPMSLIQLNKISDFNPKRLGELIHILIGQNKIIAIGNEMYLHNEQFLLLISILKKYFAEQDALSVSNFKNATALTRKTAIPLLEYLDKCHFTIRKENIRYAGQKLEE